MLKFLQNVTTLLSVIGRNHVSRNRTRSKKLTACSFLIAYNSVSFSLSIPTSSSLSGQGYQLPPLSLYRPMLLLLPDFNLASTLGPARYLRQESDHPPPTLRIPHDFEERVRIPQLSAKGIMESSRTWISYYLLSVVKLCSQLQVLTNPTQTA